MESKPASATNSAAELPESAHSASRIKFECPFDLNTVLTITHSTETLKGVLEWIIEHLGNLQNNVKQ